MEWWSLTLSAAVSIVALVAAISQATVRARNRKRAVTAREMAGAELSEARRAALENIAVRSDALVVADLCVSPAWFALPLIPAAFSFFLGYMSYPALREAHDFLAPPSVGVALLLLMTMVMAPRSVQIAVRSVVESRRVRAAYLDGEPVGVPLSPSAWIFGDGTEEGSDYLGALIVSTSLCLGSLSLALMLRSPDGRILNDLPVFFLISAMLLPVMGYALLLHSLNRRFPLKRVLDEDPHSEAACAQGSGKVMPGGVL